MPDWMRSLARHVRAMRVAHPHDRFLVVFDIDGTILDMRHMVRHLLVAYDRDHGTDHFGDLGPGDVDVHENDVATLLRRLGLPLGERRRVLAWYLDHRWRPDAVRTAHAAYPGVMAVIRWLQLQPATAVALNTGRPEALRGDTLASLAALGRSHRVRFAPDLLHMNAGGWGADVAASKVAGLRAFAAAGHRPVAVLDNEPGILAAMAAADDGGDILFLHARTLYESRRPPPPGTPAGDRYDLRALLGERDLPRQVELVWHGVNDRANLRHFLASPVRWGEGDVRRDPRGRLVMRHDPFDCRTGRPEIDHRASLRSVHDPLLAERHCTDHIWRGQAQEHGMAARCDTGGRFGAPGSARDERSHGIGVRVEHAQREPRIGHARRHRSAHPPKPDESKHLRFRHPHLLCAPAVARRIICPVLTRASQ